ncbi:DUF1049 domain-containing protein [Rhizobium sp. SL86]|jgi:uncharacterized integral membrane protein|uniref:DUF1049 domain-containing protein n=1 Tax=Rhizobium sp. SL86 TaxID=2995148 RepID=UPI0022762C0A|nr:DUF1049 domain-containing protein [Rhizobium sp. SL86]MCY1664920.1 DUF1049 domain-containing protein [Rhizobium sp. SL86]
MNRVKKILGLVIFVPLAVVLIVLCVANRQTVTLALNPFRPDDVVLSLSAPFFVFLFFTLILGMFIGSFVTWLSQGRYRKQARTEARAALKRDQDGGRKPAAQPAGAALVPAAKG